MATAASRRHHHLLLRIKLQVHTVKKSKQKHLRKTINVQKHKTHKRRIKLKSIQTVVLKLRQIKCLTLGDGNLGRERERETKTVTTISSQVTHVNHVKICEFHISVAMALFTR